MNLTLRKDGKCGEIPLPRGDYNVALHHEAGEMLLISGGKDYRIKATKRRSTGKSKHTTVNLISAGGKISSLVISTPKYGEWVAFIEFE